MAYLGYPYLNGLNGLGALDPLGYGYGLGLGYGYAGYGYGVGPYGMGLANIATTERFGLALGNEVQNFGLANLASTERNGDKNWAATHHNGLHNLMATERNGAANLIATERNYGLLSNAIIGGFGNVNTNMQQIAGQQAVQAAQYDANNITRSKDIQLQIAASTGLLSTQVSDTKNQIQKDIADAKAALELLTVQKTNELALQAVQNTNTITSRIDECCCSLNAGLTNVQNTFVNTFNNAENARLKEALATANTINLLAKAGINIPQ